MPLDVVTCYIAQNTPNSTCQLFISPNDKCEPHLSRVSKRIILEENKNAIGIKWDAHYRSEIVI